MPDPPTRWPDRELIEAALSLRSRREIHRQLAPWPAGADAVGLCSVWIGAALVCLVAWAATLAAVWFVLRAL